MTTEIAESQRVDWLLDNPGFSCMPDTLDDGFVISTWVPNGSPGNENGGGAMFVAKGKTRRDCIDQFIRGSILREGV